jgi:hypothetical protein
MTERTRPSRALRLLFAVPILGWALRDLAEGRPDAPVWALFNLVGTVALAVWIWGYPALIVAALAATATMLTLLVVGTRGR